MKQIKNRFSFWLSIAFSVFLIIEFVTIYTLPNLTFQNGFLVTINKLLTYFSIFGLILCAMSLFKVGEFLRYSFGVIFLILLGAIAYLEFNPIDTTTQSVDVKILESYNDGSKLIVRQYKNAKTNGKTQDTIRVKDTWIFRSVYQTHK